MATSIVYSSTTTGGKSLSKSITDVNPDISSGTAKEFVNKLNALTTNTVDSISRVDKTEIDTDTTYYSPVVSISASGGASGVANPTLDNGVVSVKYAWASGVTNLAQTSKVEITYKVNNNSLITPKFNITDNETLNPIYQDGDKLVVLVVGAFDEDEVGKTYTVTVPEGTYKDAINHSYLCNATTVKFVIVE